MLSDEKLLKNISEYIQINEKLTLNNIELLENSEDDKNEIILYLKGKRSAYTEILNMIRRNFL